jgi:hypothetical protein
MFSDMPVLLEDMPLHQQHTWFTPDETSPDSLCNVRQHVNQTRMSRVVVFVSNVKLSVFLLDMKPGGDVRV